jgi:hypothetical protein
LLIRGSEHRSSIEVRRQERELFFWTVKQVLLSLLLVAFVAYSIVSLVHGKVPVESQIMQLLRGP